LCMVDVSDIPDVRPGDEAEVFGPHIPVEEVAELAGTIQYELLCNVHKRVPRIYLK
ncbi:MAG: alanine racemase, partial [Oscillospiraceae bacterium]|nr:alanine racemase [Oscillospiraceae bacterium]